MVTINQKTPNNTGRQAYLTRRDEYDPVHVVWVIRTRPDGMRLVRDPARNTEQWMHPDQVDE